MGEKISKIGCILLLLFFIFACGACGEKENRVISNTGDTEKKVASPAADQAAEKPAQEESDQTKSGSGSPGQVEKKETGKDAKVSPEDAQKKSGTEEKGTSGSEKAQGESGTGGETPAVSPEGEQYQGYKGPVQGEVKYQEGTPAGENAQKYEASGDIESPYQVELIVTRDYGQQKLFGKTVGLVRDEVGMEVMFRNLDIQTAYGGGFVNAINGLESGYTFYTGEDRKKLDWFYWVNGILAPIGVAEYRPQPGDVIWWDYHDWSVTMFVPAVIGSYPQPFKSGFGGKNPGTVIMYTDEYEEEAGLLKKSLEEKGVAVVDTAPYDPTVLKTPKKYYILLGLWDKLAENSQVLQDINKKNKMVGVYVKIGEGIIEGLNFKGKVITSREDAGAVYAFGSSIGSMNPVWIVTGTGDSGFQRALHTLLDSSGDIKSCFGAIITKDGVENVPYED